MKRLLSLSVAVLLGLQSVMVYAATSEDTANEARVYLTDGTVVQGQLLDRAADLIIVRVDHEVYTFEPVQVRNIVTLNSLGGAARTETRLEFPYISFLGGTAAFGLLSWLQFDRAGDKRNEADLNRIADLPGRAAKLEDDADQAERLGWGAAALAAGSLGVALIPRRTEHRVVPALSLAHGTPALLLACRF